MTNDPEDVRWKWSREHGDVSRFYRRSAAVNSASTPRTNPHMRELHEQLNTLTLLIIDISRQQPATIQIAAIPMIPMTTSPPAHISRCIWCHSQDHSLRSECTLFAESMKSGNIRINEIGPVVLTSTGMEIPPAFGRDGMRHFYDLVCPPVSADVHLVTYDNGARINNLSGTFITMT